MTQFTLEMIENFNKAFGNHLGMIWFSDHYLIKEVITEDDWDKYFRVLKLAYLTIYNKSIKRKELSYDAYFDSVKNEAKLYNDSSTAFIVYNMKTNKTVGCIRLIYKGVLSIEKELSGFSLELLRKKRIRTAEIGRFGIIEEGSGKAHILELMMRMIATKINQELIDAVFISSVNKNQGKKMGFDTFDKVFYDKELGQSEELSWRKGESFFDPKYNPLAKGPQKAELLKVYNNFKNRLFWKNLGSFLVLDHKNIQKMTIRKD